MEIILTIALCLCILAIIGVYEQRISFMDEKLELLENEIGYLRAYISALEKTIKTYQHGQN